MSANHQNNHVTTILTRAEAEQILAKMYENSKVKPRLKEFEVRSDLNKIGFLGQYFHLLLHHEQYDDDENNIDATLKTERLFVKTLPYANEELCQYIQREGIFKKEVTLYATLLAELQKFSSSSWCPKSYLLREDLFVLQNLEESGYSSRPPQMGNFQHNEMKQLLQTLAIMHASSIAYELNTKKNIGDVYKEVLKEITISATEDYFTTGLKAILAIAKQHPDFQEPAHQAYIENELEEDLKTIYEMVNPSAKYRNVFCHRDAWVGNTFFKKAEVNQNRQTADVMLVDFQTCRYSPPAIDVIFVLNMNVSREEGRAKQFEFLTWYYECFEKALSHCNLKAEDHLSWSEFLSSFREFQLYGVLYKATAATIICAPKNYLTNMKLWSPEKHYKYSYVDRTSEVLKLMDDYSEFRECMHECVSDIMTVLGKTP